MLKKICGLFLGLVVLAGSACVTPTHASSASEVVVLTYLQTTGGSGAKEELVMLHNNSGVEVDISNWCLMNKANIAFACFVTQDSADESMQYVLLPYQSATIVSHEYSVTHGGVNDSFSLVYSVTSQSSGSIVSSSDAISLVNAEQEVVDVKSWTTPVPTGKSLSRVKLFSTPDIYAIGNDATDWTTTSIANAPTSGVELRYIPKNIDNGEGEPEDGNGDPVVDPDLDPDPEPGEETEQKESPENQPDPSPESAESSLVVMEIFANAIGADAGKEFIELHNTSKLAQYSLRGFKLRIGLDSEKWFALPDNMTIPAGGYVSFSDTDLGVALVNTQGGVQLYNGDTAVGGRLEYVSPKEGESWALIDGTWQYTNMPTPGAENTPSVNVGGEDGAKVATNQKPCASNQFRNPETGRCKLQSSTSALPTPCKVGQERNSETNRCRNIVAAEGLAPCKDGQERNLETNRCRNIVKMSSANYGVKGVQSKAGAQLSWYYWAAIVGIITLILAYAVWEWRHELASVWVKMRTSFAKK